MVTRFVLHSVLQIVFIFSCICGNSVNYVNNVAYTSQIERLVTNGKRDLHSQNRFNEIPVGSKAIKPIRKDGRTAFYCVCTSAKELNATFALPLSLPTGSDVTINNVLPQRGTFAYFKVLQCPKKNIVCRKLLPNQYLSNHFCHNEENKEEVNVKEVRTNSCIVIVNGKDLGRNENVNKKTWTEKSGHLIPMIKPHRSKVAIILDRNSTLALSNIHKIVKLDSMRKNDPVNYQHFWDSLSGFRQRRSSTISLKPMIFPNLNRNLVERKRNSSKDNKDMDVSTSPRMAKNTMQNHNNIMKNSTLHHAISIPEIHHARDRERRHKRETHVMMAKYRKETKRSKKKSRNKKKPKTTPRPKFFDDNDDCNDKGTVSSTPYTFLNVSFTGYWERPEEKTTVKPRIKNPLKMSKQDLEFVYGKGGAGSQNQREKGKNKGKSSGWSSKLSVSMTY